MFAISVAFVALVVLTVLVTFVVFEVVDDGVRDRFATVVALVAQAAEGKHRAASPSASPERAGVALAQNSYKHSSHHKWACPPDVQPASQSQPTPSGACQLTLSPELQTPWLLQFCAVEHNTIHSPQSSHATPS